MFYTEKPTELALAAAGLHGANERKPTCEPVRVSTISQSFFLLALTQDRRLEGENYATSSLVIVSSPIYWEINWP